MPVLIRLRHHASLGGINIVVHSLQQRYGWWVGKVRKGIACLSVHLARFVVESGAILISLLAAAILI